MKSYRNIFSLPPARLLKGLVGRPIISLLPKRSRAIRERPFREEWGPLSRLIRNGFQIRALAEGDHELLQHFLQDFWASSASEGFFENFQHRFDTLFLRHHSEIVDQIAAVSRGWAESPGRVVEVGVGDAQVLSYVETKLTAFQEFHGIDINEEQISCNREKFRGTSPFQFWTENAHHWLIRYPSPGTVLYTNGGVFEYMTSRQLLAMFVELARNNSPCAVAITETIAIDHDLEKESQSFPYGPEFAFSHNYPAILREAGFDIHWQHDRLTEAREENHPERWYQLVAVAKPLH